MRRPTLNVGEVLTQLHSLGSQTNKKEAANGAAAAATLSLPTDCRYNVTSNQPPQTLLPTEMDDTINPCTQTNPSLLLR